MLKRWNDVNRPLIVGGAGAAVVLAAIILTFFIDREPDRPLGKSSSVGESSSSGVDLGPAPARRLKSHQPNIPSTPSQGGRRLHPPTSENKVEPNVSKRGVVLEKETKKLPSDEKLSPTFDVVRINPDGNAVLAGRAPSNSMVRVLLGDEVIGTVKADKSGAWVLIPERPLTAGSHELRAIAKLSTNTDITSNQNVIIVVPKSGQDIAGRKTEGKTGSLAMAVTKNEKGPPVVLQTPGGAGEGELSLNAIDYGDGGKTVTLSGRAIPGKEIRVYLDNKYIGRVRPDAKGVWRLRPESEIPKGLYKMRIDLVDKAGKPTARIELPFLRAGPLRDFKAGSLVFIQPGNNLWRLARRTYGSGIRYTDIYEANKDQIRNPDLIYPGQVFVLPRGE
ncbi:MAG: LysM peptidoglycan-binding domain-containing protein [Pseudomonadota bacterium]|nr:LysM peptidoglycan-binding domain-containing protein [Pseudomonadota bacterium]